MGKKLVSEDHNDQRSENSPSLEDHSVDELAKGLHTGTIFLLGARRLVLMTFSVALAVVILGATAFAQGNAAQDQYGPQTTPPTAPPTTPNLKEWHPPTPNTGSPGGQTSNTGSPGGQTSNTGSSGGQTPDPRNQGGQKTPDPGNQGGQTPDPGSSGGQTPDPGNPGSANAPGGSQKYQQPDQQKGGLIPQIGSFLSSIFNGGNTHEQGQQGQQKGGLLTGFLNLLSPLLGAPQGETQQARDTGGLIPGIVNNFLRPIFGAGQGEAQKIDKTGQKKSGEVALTPRAKLDPNTLQPPPPLGSPDLKRALEHDSIEVPSPSDPVITVEWPTNEPNEVKLLKEALRAGDCALTLSEGGGDEVDKLSCAIGGAKTLFDAKVPPELEHQLLAHNCATSVIKLLTPGRAVHGLIGASMCSIEVGLELAEQPTKAPPGSLPPDKIKLPPNVGPIDIQGRH